MRSNTLAILGLVAATQALPMREKRQFIIGDPNVDFCVGNQCSGNGLIFTPSPNPPPGFTIGKKRSPQYEGPSKGHGGDKGGKGGKWGKPDDPWHPDEPSHPEEPTPTVPPKEPEKPDYPKDDEKPGHGDKPDYPEPDYPEHDYPEEEASREDIIEAQQTLLLLQQMVPGVTDPEQKAAMQAAIDEAKEFLRVHAGIVDISAPPGVGTVLIPGGKVKRTTKSKVDVEALYDALVQLLKSENPSFPVYMVAEQLVQRLLEEGFEFDPTILGVYSSMSPKAKRQDGIFALPGSCKLEDIIGLETTLATILLIYGPDPPPSISSLRNAVTAALLFCKNAPDIESDITIEEPDEGAPVVPEEPVEGDITIEEPVEGDITIEEPVEGDITIEEPEEGSIELERPTRTAPQEPEETADEGDEEADGESTLVVEEGVEGSIEIVEGEEGSITINEP